MSAAGTQTQKQTHTRTQADADADARKDAPTPAETSVRTDGNGTPDGHAQSDGQSRNGKSGNGKSGKGTGRLIPRGRGARRARRLAPGRPLRFGKALGPVLLLAVWSAGSAAGLIEPRLLSAPWTVVTTAGDLVADGRLQGHLASSAQRAALGLLFGTAAGLLLALAAGLSRIGEGLIDGPVQMKRALPSLALVPLLVLWFGIGESMKVITVALAVFVPVYIHTHNGLRTIDSRYVELSETVRLNRRQFIRHVVLPGALPGFLLGMRFAVTAAWLALVVVEQVNATSGLGYMMELARTYGQTEIIIVGLVVYGLLGLLSDGLVRYAERKVLSWRRTLAS